MPLDNRLIPFIDDEVEYREFMNMFMGLITSYHEDYNSKEFEFDFIRFVTEWQNKKLGVFIAYNGETPVGFVLASVMHGFFDDSPTFGLTHAYLSGEFRGDVDYIKSACDFLRDQAPNFGCDKSVVLATPELMPLIMSIGGKQVLYSGVEM